MTKTLLDSSVAEDYFNNKKIWAYDYLKTKTPHDLPCWGWVAFKVNNELHILEVAFDEEAKIHWVLGVVNY